MLRRRGCAGYHPLDGCLLWKLAAYDDGLLTILGGSSISADAGLDGLVGWGCGC
jgi:hypothetical protein